MAKVLDLDYEAEEAIPDEPVECQPQERQNQT